MFQETFVKLLRFGGQTFLKPAAQISHIPADGDCSMSKWRRSHGRRERREPFANDTFNDTEFKPF